MTMNSYYIEYNQQQLGPFDMVSMMRKIRNGQVVRETVIYVNQDEEPHQAGEYLEFHEFFLELERAPATGEEETRRMPSLSFVQLMKNGMEHLSVNLVMSVYSGIFLLLLSITLVVLYLVIGANALLAVLGSVIGCFFFSFYLLTILRKVRMQLLSRSYLGAIIKRAGKPLLIISLLLGTAVFAVPIALAMLVGPIALALILLPGSLLFLLFLFAPVLAADRGLGAIESLKQSSTLVRSVGGNNFIALYLVMLVNFIAATIPIFLVITLPVTIAALCEVYDDHFNEFSIA